VAIDCVVGRLVVHENATFILIFIEWFIYLSIYPTILSILIILSIKSIFL
jgi:hypothetical protein